MYLKARDIFKMGKTQDRPSSVEWGILNKSSFCILSSKQSISVFIFNSIVIIYSFWGKVICRGDYTRILLTSDLYTIT